MNSLAPAFAFALAFPVLAAAAPAPAPAAPKPARAASGRSGRANYRLSFNIKAAELVAAGSFVIRDGEKSSYVWGGEKPYITETSKGAPVIDFKKFSTLAQCSLAAEPGGRQLSLECQFEVSGTLPPDGEGTLRAYPVATFQYTAPFTMNKGDTFTLVDDTQHHIDVHVEEIGPGLPPDKSAPVQKDEPPTGAPR